jgi:hypothetical protein
MIENRLAQQGSSIRSSSLQSESEENAIYIVSENLAKEVKPFGDREIIKEFLEVIADIARTKHTR